MFMTENVQAALLSLPMELERMGAKLQTGLAEFHNGQRLDAARYVDAGRAPLLWGDRCRIVGWSLVEDAEAPAPARLVLRNGRDDSAEVVAVVDLDASSSSTQWLGPSGVAVGEALWATVTGSVAGAVYLGAVD